MESFYNTINLSGKELELQNASAKGQEDLILAIFEANPKMELSPIQILSIFKERFDRNPPITSIRRAMSNLTDKKKVLLKTTTLVSGQYHLPNHCWILRKGNEWNENIKTEKFQGPTIAEYAEILTPKKQGDLFD